MADQNGTPAAAQPVQAAAQPAQAQSFNVPEGYQLTPKSDIERYSRYEQQVRGFEPMYQKLTKAGIKTAEDWDKYAPAIDTFNKHKIDPKAFASMYSPEAEADLNPGKQPQSIDIEALRKQIREETMDAVYQDRHEESRKSDGQMIDTAFTKIVGEGQMSNFDKMNLKNSVAKWLSDNQDTYPEGHRLRGKALAPISKDLVEKAVAYFAAEKAKDAGASIAEAAANAVKPVQKTGTVGGGSGAPPGKPTSNPNQPTSQREKRAAVEAEFARLQASRGR